MQKTCIKCNHIAEFEDEFQEPKTCIKCGFVYAKANTQPPFRQSSLKSTPSRKKETLRESISRVSYSDDSAFLANLRNNSAYPAFRQVVNWFYATGISIVVLFGLATLIGTIFTSFGRLPVFFFGTVLTIMTYIGVRVSKDVSLMIADMSDATLFSAEKLNRSHKNNSGYDSLS